MLQLRCHTKSPPCAAATRNICAPMRRDRSFCAVCVHPETSPAPVVLACKLRLGADVTSDRFSRSCGSTSGRGPGRAGYAARNSALVLYPSAEDPGGGAPMTSSWDPGAVGLRVSAATKSVGFWSAVLATVFSLTYDVGQLAEWLGWLGSGGGPESASTPLGLVVLLTPSLLLGSSFLVLIVSVHQLAPPANRVWSHVAVAFATVYAVLISLNYFVQLTLVAPPARAWAGPRHRGVPVRSVRFVPLRSGHPRLQLHESGHSVRGARVQWCRALWRCTLVPDREWNVAPLHRATDVLAPPHLACGAVGCYVSGIDLVPGSHFQARDRQRSDRRDATRLSAGLPVRRAVLLAVAPPARQTQPPSRVRSRSNSAATASITKRTRTVLRWSGGMTRNTSTLVTTDGVRRTSDGSPCATKQGSTDTPIPALTAFITEGTLSPVSTTSSGWHCSSSQTAPAERPAAPA